MPLLNSRSDLFKVELPRIFLPDTITNNYKPYLHRMPTMIDAPIDLVNASIQTVTIPAASYDPVDQQRSSSRPNIPGRHRGEGKFFRTSQEAGDLIEKSFTITMKLYDGFVNYWIMQEAFYYYFNYQNTNTYIVDIPVRILDSEGNLMYSVIYSDVLFTGISEFSLSYSDNIQQFNTFDCSFTFNDMRIKFEID